MTGLIELLVAGVPRSARRMRDVVGERRARIFLDDEHSEVTFEAGELVATGEEVGPVDGVGRTDRETVLNLLDGYLDVTDAVLEGFLQVRGEGGSVVRMFVAIEILLDASTRLPGLRHLADNFRYDPCRPPLARSAPPARSRSDAWYPSYRFAGEEAMLSSLGLLPVDPPAGPNAG